MNPHQLLFWRQEATVRLLPQSIAQELNWGQDVKGLEDLPVKEILTKIKEALPQAVERAGLLSGEAQSGNWEITWGWQFMKLESPPGESDLQQVVIDILSEAGVPAYDPQQGLRHPQP